MTDPRFPVKDYDEAVFVIETAAKVWRVQNDSDGADRILQALSTLKSGNDATKNEAASAGEVGPPNGTAWGCEADSGAALIAAERLRQITAEGWTPEHDDEHKGEQMAKAAYAYITYGTNPRYPKFAPPSCWPWDSQWWKPSDRTRNLVRAGALIAAEIDRLKRGEAASPAQNPAKATTEEDPVTDEAEIETNQGDALQGKDAHLNERLTKVHKTEGQG